MHKRLNLGAIQHQFDPFTKHSPRLRLATETLHDYGRISDEDSRTDQLKSHRLTERNQNPKANSGQTTSKNLKKSMANKYKTTTSKTSPKSHKSLQKIIEIVSKSIKNKTPSQKNEGDRTKIPKSKTYETFSKQVDLNGYATCLSLPRGSNLTVSDGRDHSFGKESQKVIAKSKNLERITERRESELMKSSLN